MTTYAPHYQGPAPGTGQLIGGVLYGGTPGPGGELYDPLDPWELANSAPQERNMTVDRESIEANWQFGNGITFRSLTSNIVMNRLQTEGGAGHSLVYQSYQGWQLGPGMQTWSQEFNLISSRGAAGRMAGRLVPKQSAYRAAHEQSGQSRAEQQLRQLRLGVR